MLKSFHAITDKGPYFNINQDGFISKMEHGLFGVIDAFGGTGIGDQLTKNLIKHIEGVFEDSSHDQDKTLKYFFDHHRSIECNFLVNAVLSFHDSVLLENESKGIHQRAGASATFLVCKSNTVTVVSIGNTSVHLIRNQMLNKVVLEDNVFPFESSELNSSPKSALGLFSPLFPTIKEFRIFADDSLLITTKGAMFKMGSDEILNLLKENMSPKDSLNSLFAKSNQNGNRDNQTGLLLHF